MLMVTLRKPEFKKLAAVCAGAALCAAAAFAVNAFTGGPVVETAAEPAVQVTDLSSLTAYLSGYGLEIDPSSVSVDTVSVPRKWDDSFTAFNDVIRQIGLDLKSARGKDVEKWTALVPAKSTDSEKIYAVVLAYKNTPVGAYFLERPSGEVLPLVTQAEDAQSEKASAEAEASVETAASLPAAEASADATSTVEASAYPTE